MLACYSQKERCRSNCDKTNPVMNDDEVKPKSLYGLFGNLFQLVFGHFTMRLVVDSLNFAAILDWSDYAPEINKCAGASGLACVCRKRCFCHRNFANDICHAFKLVATVTDSELSSHKEIQK